MGLHVEQDGGRGGRTRAPLGQEAQRRAGTCPASHFVRSGQLSQAIRCLLSLLGGPLMLLPMERQSGW